MTASVDVAIRTSDGVSLQGRCWMPSSPPRAAVALVHGFGEHSGRYANLVQALVDSGIAAYAVDLRGHGRSPGKRGHVMRWEEFHHDVTALLKEIERRYPHLPVFLYGHSMGALIVLDYALDHTGGLSGVIASGPPLGKIGVHPALLAAGKVISRIYPSFSMNAGLSRDALSRDPEVALACDQDPLVHSRGSARLSTELAAAMQRVGIGAPKFRLPLLVLHGEVDRIADPEGSRLFVERAGSTDKQRIVYPGGYHEPHNDLDHASVVSDVTGWIELRIPASVS